MLAAVVAVDQGRCCEYVYVYVDVGSERKRKRKRERKRHGDE